MKPYDFALILVRVLALTNVIEGSVSIPFSIVRFIIASVESPKFYPLLVLADIINRSTFPLEEIASGLVFLIFSKSIARFGAKSVLSLSEVFS
jgi:hypothetical protein